MVTHIDLYNSHLVWLNSDHSRQVPLYHCAENSGGFLFIVAKISYYTHLKEVDKKSLLKLGNLV